MSANFVDPSIWKSSGFFSMPFRIISMVPSGCGFTSSLGSGEPTAIVNVLDLEKVDTKAVIGLTCLYVFEKVVDYRKIYLLHRQPDASLVQD